MTASSLYQLFRSQIEHEDNLVNHRVSWLVGSQSFLLGTYVFLVNNPLFYPDPVESSVKRFSKQLELIDINQFIGSIQLLRWAYSLTGLFVAVLVWLSVWAALGAITDLRYKYAELRNGVSDLPENEYVPAVLSRPCWRLLGLAAVLLPPVFASVWFCFLMQACGVHVGVSVVVAIALLAIGCLMPSHFVRERA